VDGCPFAPRFTDLRVADGQRPPPIKTEQRDFAGRLTPAQLTEFDRRALVFLGLAG
jgi:hypothetical protein